MKSFVSFLMCLVIGVSASAQNDDVPTPTAHLQTLPSGSYVIPMDNKLQTDNTIGNGKFNLAAYGLIVHLLNNNVKVKWVIKTGKTKDANDFTDSAEQLKPTFVSGAVSRNFLAGPFVIFADDTAGVASKIDAFYTAQSLSGNNRPKVFRLTASVANVDIRYDLTGFKPKAAILTDGGNETIHTDYMVAAKIPTSNYLLATGNDLLVKCFSFATEPHNTKTGATVDATISALKRFIQYGGSFLAQCAAVENYENNSLGRFQTTTGITTINANVSTNLSYPNPDLSYSQFQGAIDGSSGGSVQNWSINSGTANGEHNHATGTGGNANAITASVSKMNSSGSKGGLVFYMGIHSFSTTTAVGINGIRMYMNAFLTPISVNNTCTTGQILTFPVPIKLTFFNANLSLDQSKVNLTWTTAQETNASHFVVERSTDGTNFNEVGTVFAAGNSNEPRNYMLADKVNTLEATVIYYRLRQVDIDGRADYSATRIVRMAKQSGNTITILAYPNPVTSELRVTLPASWQNKKVSCELVNVNGQTVKKSENANSSQTETLNVSSVAPGFYFVKVTCEGQTAQQKIVKQ